MLNAPADLQTPPPPQPPPPPPPLPPVETVAAYISGHRDRICTLWLHQVKAEVAATKRYSDDKIVDNLPEYLAAMAAVVACPENPEIDQRLDQACRLHAQERSALTDYSLADVLTEHHILRHICFSELYRNVDISLDVSHVVSEAIFRGVLESSSAFSSLLIEKLQAAIRNLESERESREQLVLALTHDLRQPLQIICITAQIVQREDDRGRQLHFIEKILEHSRRAASMLDDLLDASRVHAGEKLRLNLEACDLRQLCTRIASDMAAPYGDRFICDAPEPANGFWDAAKLRRALENLLVNAVKYGGQETPITLSIRASGENVECAVHNQGNPIPPEHLPLIFGQYYRTPVACRAASKGWGLGLALVRGIAAAHGGSVSADSSAKDGTIFRMILPRDARSYQQKVDAT